MELNNYSAVSSDINRSNCDHNGIIGKTHLDAWLLGFGYSQCKLSFSVLDIFCKKTGNLLDLAVVLKPRAIVLPWICLFLDKQ